MKFPHLKGREKLLEPLGFTRQQVEWITLVCLHSGLFTRDQVEAFFGYAKSSANRFIQALLRTRISHKPIASETITDGRRICRIFGKQIYRELEIPHIRHRRETSLEVARRRLLSLDFVLDHPELPWLGTEREKLACFQQLGIERGLLPCRIYAGHAKGQIHYFPLKMPVAMGPEAAVFVYIDPGMGTRSELNSWREAHRPLWQMLRECGWRIEVVAVAWEQELLDRAERVLQSWIGRDMTEADRELLILRWAVSSADWDTVERYGGLNAALKKINQLTQATPEPKGLGMIDDFHLWGSRRCRRIHAPLKKGGGSSRWCTLLTTTTLLSQRARLAAVVESLPGNPLRKRVGMDSRHPLRQSGARLRLACPAPRPARPRAAREGCWWRERPPFFGRWCATGEGELVHPNGHTISPPLWGVAPSTVIPAGRPSDRLG